MGYTTTIKAVEMLQYLLSHTYMPPHREKRQPNTCLHTGRHAYIHAHPLIIVCKGACDTLRTVIEVREEWVGRNRAG